MIKKKISQLDLANASLSGYLPMSDSAGTVTNKITIQSLLSLGGGGGGGSASFVEASAPSGFPASGVSNNLYIATDSSKFYRWDSSNSVYVETGSAAGGSFDFTPYFMPPAPTNLSVIPGDSQVTLSWTAPSVISQIPITDYIVQYSSNNGSSWTTFSDSLSVSTNTTVINLNNGTNYIFRVAAINDVGTGSWSSTSNPVQPGIQVSVSYLVVAGGGGGGCSFGGGGGSGGIKTGTTNVTAGNSLSIVVGGGGIGAAGTSDRNNGSSGNNSIFNLLTSIGGGGGGGESKNGSSGGSGGGASRGSGAGGTGISGQGYRGGNSTHDLQGAGGGGAGAQGEDSVQQSYGSVGGGGVSSSITGNTVIYAAGGGGGGFYNLYGTGGDGGNGGGGKGGGYNNPNDLFAGGNGVASRGSGGGGGGYGTLNPQGAVFGAGGSGSSGIVILRTLATAATTTGSPTITQDGNYTIYTFTGSGSITF